jgi:hypothetical protein
VTLPQSRGENYAAPAEGLGDLDWIDASRVVLIISEFPELVMDEPIELRAFGRALASGIEEYNRSRKNAVLSQSLFRVIVNVPVSADVDSESLFSKAFGRGPQDGSNQ